MLDIPMKRLPEHIKKSDDKRSMTCTHCWSTFILAGSENFLGWYAYHEKEKHDPEWKRDAEKEASQTEETK